MEKSTFYHAGCPVCVNAENEMIELIGASNLDIIHLGETRELIQKAEDEGVKSVPAIVTPTGSVLHINFGASLEDVRG